MPMFMVERYVPGATVDGLLASVARTLEAVMTLERRGAAPVRYLRCTFVPSEGSVFCFFEGPSREAVEAVNLQARFGFDQVVEVIEMVPGSPGVLS